MTSATMQPRYHLYVCDAVTNILFRLQKLQQTRNDSTNRDFCYTFRFVSHKKGFAIFQHTHQASRPKAKDARGRLGLYWVYINNCLSNYAI